MNNANILQLKEGFLLREIAGRIVVLPIEDSMNLNLMISLNSTGFHGSDHSHTEMAIFTECASIPTTYLGRLLMSRTVASTCFSSVILLPFLIADTH